MVLGRVSEEVNGFFYKALYALAEDWGVEELLPLVLETGKVNLACMELLDSANTETFGTPAPAEVPLTWRRGRSSLLPAMISMT